MNLKRMLILMILIVVTAATILIAKILDYKEEELFFDLAVEPIVNEVDLLEVCGTASPTEEVKTLVKDPLLDEVELLAIIGDLEAGADWCTDETQQDVMSVVVNRVNDPAYPDTIEGVIYQPGQYSTAKRVKGHIPTERARRNAKKVLTEGVTLPEGTIFQANFVQGTVVKQAQGLYFGKRKS